MGNSLQDQLIGAGLIDKKKANKLKAEKSKRQRQQRKAGQVEAEAKTPTGKPDRAAIAKDRELNRRREQRKARKAAAAQIRQLIAAHAIADAQDADIGYNFVDQGKVKKIYVSDKSRLAITNGKLAIVRADRRYSLMPADFVDKLRQRDPDCIVLYNSTAIGSDDGDTEDEYPQHQVPDDLVW